MNFTKMHGLGNDFLVVKGLEEDIPTIIKNAKKICDRHFGVGADGILLVLPSDVADIKMRIINSDGSEAPMCGNGVRCFASFVYKKGIVAKKNMTVETIAGIQRPEIIMKDDIVTAIKVDIGTYSFLNQDIPVEGEPDKEAKNLEIKIDENLFEATGVDMGNPHCVIFTDDVEKVPLEKWGPKIENYPLFPLKTNVEFVQVISKDHLKMRVWERGCGITMACGTGACAVAAAAFEKGFTGKQVKVTLPGGDLFIELTDDKRVYMTGPAREVFEGRLELEKIC